MRITFLGDIIISKEQLASHKSGDSYDFSAVKNALNGAFSGSDFVVANLETPVAGSEMGFTDSEYSFNTPSELLDALKDTGINMLQTANNHCLDRGVEGLRKTMFEISGKGLLYIGTHLKEENSYKVIEIGGIKAGFLAYTYGTNAFDNGCYLKKDESYMVDLLQKQELSGAFERMIYSSDNRVNRYSKKMLGKINPQRYGAPVYERPEPCKEERIRLREQIRKCKEEGGAEFVIVLLHIGGQFNAMPSGYTVEVCEYCRENGANLVIANHEHVIHPYKKDSTFCWYSLGNFLSSDGVWNEPFDNLCQYSAVVHADLGREDDGLSARYGFELFLSHENEEGQIVSEPVYDLFEKCNDGSQKQKIRSECELLLNRIYGTSDCTYEMRPCYEVDDTGDKL